MTERGGGGKTSLLLNSDVTVTTMTFEEGVVVGTDAPPPLSTYVDAYVGMGWFSPPLSPPSSLGKLLKRHVNVI